MGLYAPYFYFLVSSPIMMQPRIAPKNGPRILMHIANIKIINANLGNKKNINRPNINNNIVIPPYLLISNNAQIISMSIIIPMKNGPNNDTSTVKTNNGNIVINNKCLFFHIMKRIIKNIISHIINISFFSLDYYKYNY